VVVPTRQPDGITCINMQYIIFVLQIIAYLSLLPLFLINDIHHYILAILIYFFMNAIGMSMTYHRLLSHRSFTCNKLIEYIGTTLGGLALTGSAITWVAMHRQHHKYSDSAKDPHSPDNLGWVRVQFKTAFSKINGKNAVDLMRNKFYIFQHRYYFGIIIAYATLLAFLNPLYVISAFLAPAGLTLFFGTLVLSSCHKDYKPRTIPFLAIVTFGESYHLEHHKDARIFRLHKYDITGWIIEKFIHDKTTILGKVN